MAATFSILDWLNGDNGLKYTGNLTGESLKVLRVNAGETGFELAVDALVAVAVTSPLTVSGTTTRTIALAGLTGVGSGGQVVMSTGSAWGYVSSTGSGNFVRAASPTITGTLTVSAVTSASGAWQIGTLSGTAFRLVQASSDGTISTLGIGAAGQAIRLNSGATGWEYFTPMVGDVTGVTGTSPIIVTSSGGPVPNVSIAGLSGAGSFGQSPMSDGTAWSYVSSTGTGSFVHADSPTITGTLTASLISATRLNLGGATDVSGVAVNVLGGSIFTAGGQRVGGFGAGSVAEANGEYVSMYHDSIQGVLDVGKNGTGSYRPLQLWTSNTARLSISAAGVTSILSGLGVSGNLGFFAATPVAIQTVDDPGFTAFPNPVTDTAAFLSANNTLLASYQSLLTALGNRSGNVKYGLINVT